MLASFKSVRHKWLAFTALALAMAAINWPEQQDNQAASALPMPTISPAMIATPALPAVAPMISPAEQEAEQEAIDAAFDGGGIPQSEVLRVTDVNLPGPIYSSEQERMLDYSNYLCDKHRIANRPASPELMAAAQTHAEFLAGRGYGAYFGVSQPNAHDGWGDGTPRSRASASGFTGSLATDDPTSIIPGHNVTGEIIYCGKVPLEKAFEDWQKHDTLHWVPLTSPTFDVAGFGYAENSSGQGIFVGMFGNTRKLAADEPPMATFASHSPARSSPAQQAGRYESYGILGRRQRWVNGVGHQQGYRQPVCQSYGQSYGSCAGASCGRR